MSMGQVLILAYMCAYVCACMRVHICGYAHITVCANAQAWAQVLALQAVSIQQLSHKHLPDTILNAEVKKTYKIPSLWDLIF